MDVDKFIQQCADTMKDSNFEAIGIDEWKDIINSQSPELFPDINYTKVKSVTVSTGLNLDTYELDMSAEGDIQGITSVSLIDSHGREIPYANWIYLEDRKILDLRPEFYKTHHGGENVEEVMGDLNEDWYTSEPDPANYTTIKVIWFGIHPEITLDGDTITLRGDHIQLLRKMCVKEAMRRIIYDRTKMDKFRTTVGDMNEYALLAIYRDLTNEVEIQKRSLSNATNVKYF